MVGAGMAGERAAPVLRGRSEECRALDRLIARVRSGQSGALVLRGEAGVGKTALLDYAAERASGCRLARLAGVESEMGFAFSGLLQLMRGAMLERAEQLPAPQRDALRRAAGLIDGPAPETFLVSLAALNVLCQVAEERPLVCLVDDAQWLDRESASALSFVARRLAAEGVAMLFAVREPSTEHELDGLPELGLEGLGDADARLLLDAAVPGGLDEQVRERIVTETRGNPLALLELTRGLTPAELAGGFGLPDERELSNRIEQTFLQRVQALPQATQTALLVAAAEAVGDASVIAQAAGRLGVGPADLIAAEDADLIALGARVRFRHPLVRSAAYRAATPNARRHAHHALAAATDPERDPDRRAWHRAHAAAGADESVAAELEASASRAQARGGAAAAAAFLERAAELSPNPAQSGVRALGAARLKLDVGALEAAERLLTLATTSPLEELDHARAQRLRAELAFARTPGSDTPALLSDAAKRLEPLDPELARETHLEALWAALRSGFAESTEVVEAAQAATLPPGQGPARALDLLLDGVLARLTRGYEPALPAVSRALAAFRAEGFSRENLAWCWLACQLAMDFWKDDACEEICTGLGRVARESGGLTVLPLALNYSAAHQLHLGEFGIAEQLMREVETIAAATGNVQIADFSILLAAWRGDRETTYKLRAAAIEAGTARGEAFAIAAAEHAVAILHNGLGDYADAAAAAQHAYDLDVLGFGVWVLPELVEAAVRSGDRPVAELAFARLAERSGTSATEWARGVEAAMHALLTNGVQAEELHLEAIDQLSRSRVLVLHARARLNYGEWLRREQRRVDARAQLKAAYEAFEAMGARGFAERARRELLATGETVRKRTIDTRDELTPQEAQIARLASERLTNPEIAAQLYLSHRTVEYHLRKVFTKLGISSRKELADALSASRSALVPV
jgi:DNA-binding CsgD family transcriptional regulator